MREKGHGGGLTRKFEEERIANCWLGGWKLYKLEEKDNGIGILEDS